MIEAIIVITVLSSAISFGYNIGLAKCHKTYMDGFKKGADYMLLVTRPNFNNKGDNKNE